MTLVTEPTTMPQSGQQPLTNDEARELARQVPQWLLADSTLTRDFSFQDFEEAMEFANEVARVALEADHHPRICIDYRQVRLELTTHKVRGLSRNDFIVASRVDELL